MCIPMKLAGKTSFKFQHFRDMVWTVWTVEVWSDSISESTSATWNWTWLHWCQAKSLESSWVAWSLQCDGCEVTASCLSCPTWPQPSDSLQALEIVMTWCPLLAMLRKECQIDVGMWRPIPFPGRFYTANYNHFNFWTVEVIGVIELLVLLDASWLA